MGSGGTKVVGRDFVSRSTVDLAAKPHFSYMYTYMYMCIRLYIVVHTEWFCSQYVYATFVASRGVLYKFTIHETKRGTWGNVLYTNICCAAFKYLCVIFRCKTPNSKVFCMAPP